MSTDLIELDKSAYLKASKRELVIHNKIFPKNKHHNLAIWTSDV